MGKANVYLTLHLPRKCEYVNISGKIIPIIENYAEPRRIHLIKHFLLAKVKAVILRIFPRIFNIYRVPLFQNIALQSENRLNLVIAAFLLRNVRYSC